MKKTICIIKSILLTTILLICFSCDCCAQVLDDLKEQFQQFSQNNFQEKLFMHTDKSVYLAGEILWFKIYDVEGIHHTPFNLTKVAYIEIVDNSHRAVLQLKVSMKDGKGNGSFYLPFSTNSGNYKIRAYTSWMKNYSADYYFEKGITIINTLKSPVTTPAAGAEQYDVQFFPEGGNLVNGITSKVAFRVVGKDGKGIDYKGAIVNGRNDTLTRFTPLKFGIGTFLYTPSIGNTCKAVIRVASGDLITKQLPQITDKGYVMQLTDDGSGRLHITIQSNMGSSTSGTETVYLLAHTRQELKVVQSLNFDRKGEFVIDENKLGDGISHITIFNAMRQPVCERLYFKKPKQKLLITAGTNQKEFSVRKKVEVDISVNDQDTKSVAANLSVSVFKLDSLQGVEQENIQSYLWLTSDLSGSIESANYYFDHEDTETKIALDNLVLSQGWSRFNWNKVLKDQKIAFKFLPEFEGHIITGKITDTRNSGPAKNILTYLSVPGKKVQFYSSRSDSSGKILFNTKDFYGLNEVVLQTNLLKDSLYKIEISNPFSEQFSNSHFSNFLINKNLEGPLKDYSLDMQVQNLYSGKYIRRFYNPLIDSTAFFGKPDKLYKLDDYTRFTTMEEVLREYIREIAVSHLQGKYRLKILSQDDGPLADNPLVLIDGVPVFDMDKLIAMDPLKINTLAIVAQEYDYHALNEDGVLSYTTYKGDLGGFEIDPHAVVIDYEGLQLKRDFFSPVYQTDKQHGSRVPDFRNLLYWMPDMDTGADGKIHFSFYTSDQEGVYNVNIQGISRKGSLGSKGFTFQVKK